MAEQIKEVEKPKTKINKPHHITNIRYPYAKSWDKLNTHIEFELANIHSSTANAIRRLMISTVKTVGFRTEPYTACDLKVIANDTPLHNQFILHRIAMVPIHIPKPEAFDVDNYLFIINLSNNTNSTINITTGDFQIKEISTNRMLSKNDVEKFFPKDPITGDYILLNILKPKHYNTPNNLVSKATVDEMNKEFSKLNTGEDVTQFHVEGKASISNGSENGHYSPVACASYINTVDPDKADFGLKEYITKQNTIAKEKSIVAMTNEKMKRRFDLTERARFFYTNDKDEPNVFTFKIETVGIIPPLIIFYRAIDILKNKITDFVNNLVKKNENIITIKTSGQLGGGYDIIVKNEDDTLGNIIQSHLCLMYSDYSLPKEKQKLKYIGYKKPHPLEHYIVFAIQGLTDNIDEIINDIIKPGCSEIVKILNKIQNDLEGTQQFVGELKMIE